MTPSSAPPLPSSVPSTLLLQRRLSRGDSRKWRTLLRLRHEQMPLAEQLVRLAIQIDPQIQWRLTTAAGALLAEQ